MKLQNGVYNKAVYWPEELKSKLEMTMGIKYKLHPTFHFENRCIEYNLPLKLYRAAIKGEIVECELKYNRIVKIITRMRDGYDEKFDLCFAISLDTWNANVKTVWRNRNSDWHNTIKFKFYVKEE